MGMEAILYWSRDLDHLYIQWLPHLIDASHNIWLQLIGQVVLEEMMFEYYGDIHVYCPGVGAYEPPGSIFSESLIFSPTANFLQDFHFK